jgi:hypothetical protein
MNFSFKQFIAVLLAIWLPLFSGSALAASMVMPSMGGECHLSHSGAHQTDYNSSVHLHMQIATDQSAAFQQQTPQPNSQNSSQKDCGVCQLACCAYLIAVTVAIVDIPSAAQLFYPSSTQFQSYTSAPLDPPPLARA